MPIFPDDDIGPHEDQWQFCRIEFMTNGDLEIEPLTYWSSRAPSSEEFSIQPGQKCQSIQISRIRSSIGGGFYPNLYISLCKLLAACEKDGVWKNHTVVPMSRLINGDIVIESDYKIPSNLLKDNKSLDRISAIPIVISAATLATSPHAKTAVGSLFTAIKTEVPKVLWVWSLFPEDFHLRKIAEEQLAQFGRPIDKRPHAKANRRNINL